MRTKEIHKSLTKDQVHNRNNNSYFVATEHNPVAAEGSGGDSAGVRFGHTMREFKAMDKANATKWTSFVALVERQQRKPINRRSTVRQGLDNEERV